MTQEEFMKIMEGFAIKAEVLVNTGDRYAEIKDIRLEYSQRPDQRKPYVIIDIY